VSVERTYEGNSPNGNLQEALERALELLAADLDKGGVRGASATWVVTEIAGEYVGWGELQSKVKIAAKRSPEWGHG